MGTTLLLLVMAGMAFTLTPTISYNESIIHHKLSQFMNHHTFQNHQPLSPMSELHGFQDSLLSDGTEIHASEPNAHLRHHGSSERHLKTNPTSTLPPNIVEQLENIVRPCSRDLRVAGRCYRAILHIVCDRWVLTETDNFVVRKLSCEGNDCSLQNFRKHCAYKKETPTIPTASVAQRQNGILPDNPNPLCGRFNRDEIYEQVRHESGVNCERQLRCICGDYCPEPMLKKEALQKLWGNKLEVHNSRPQIASFRGTPISSRELPINYQLSKRSAIYRRYNKKQILPSHRRSFHRKNY